MYDNINLPDIDKLDFINHGFDPNLDRSTHGQFKMDKILEALQNKKVAVVFPGLKFIYCGFNEDKTSIEFTQRQPFLFISHPDDPDGYFQIHSFNPAETEDISRFMFNLSEAKLIGDHEIFYRGALDLKILEDVITVCPLYADYGDLQIAIPNKIKKSEIHKNFFEQIAENYKLNFEDRKTERFYDDNAAVLEKQTFSTQDNRLFSVSAYRRKGKYGFFPQDVIIDTQDQGLLSRLKGEANPSFYLDLKENSVIIKENICQTKNIDKVLRALLYHESL